MIVARSPLRVTLGGGGTDLPSYYRDHGGFIFAMAIDRYVHVMLNRPALGSSVRVAYSRLESASRVAGLEHELAREALTLHGIEDRIEVASVSDLPEGTGLGSSGSYLVALLAAIRAELGEPIRATTVAEEACAIEIEVLGKPVGKQDPYMAAVGGLTVLDIARDGTVRARPVTPPPGALEALVANTHLYYTGVRRSAAAVLADQDRAMSAGPRAPSDRTVADSLHRIRDLGHRILAAVEAGDIDGWGRLLHEHWENKKRLSRRVSVDGVDDLYTHVRSEFGVMGGKIAGAGGGGFLALYCPGGHDRLEAFMRDRGMPRLHYDVATDGVRVMARSEPRFQAVAAPTPGPVPATGLS
jgi:D-glycero-alpha-D-manno-heptose-7-phosphate kinase